MCDLGNLGFSLRFVKNRGSSLSLKLDEIMLRVGKAVVAGLAKITIRTFAALEQASFNSF